MDVARKLLIAKAWTIGKPILSEPIFHASGFGHVIIFLYLCASKFEM